jgi:hypothetical protein
MLQKHPVAHWVMADGTISLSHGDILRSITNSKCGRNKYISTYIVAMYIFIKHFKILSCVLYVNQKIKATNLIQSIFGNVYNCNLIGKVSLY